MAEPEIRFGWLAAARAWTSRVVSRVMAPWRTAQLPPDAGAVLTFGDDWAQLVGEHTGPPILDTLRDGYTGQAGPPPPGFDEQAFVIQYLASAVNRMSNTDEQVYRFVTEQLGKGIAEGDDPARLALRVQAVFTVTGNPWWEGRAATVARTETVAALNAGALEGARHLETVSGRVMTKRWVALDEPGRTRDAHLFADGQTQLLGVPFLVGGEQLQYPGDPAGSATNVINCRCSLRFD